MARFFARAWHTASEESAYGIKISLSESPFTYQYALLCGKNKRLVLLNGTLHVRCRAWPSISTKKAAAEHGDLRRSGGWQLMAWRPIPYRKSNRFKYRIHLEHNYDYIRDSNQFIYHKWYPHFNASEDPISYACLHPAGSFCAWRYSTSSNFQVSKGWFRMSCKMVGST